MCYDFLAVDFETARPSLDSACSIGIVGVKNLEIVTSEYSLLHPPTLNFDARNISVHGITPNMVKDAPTLDEYWTKISGMFSVHCPVVAHNAHFDMSALRLSMHGEIPNFPYLDSMSIVSPIVDGSRSLSHCAEAMGIDMGSHHNALDDARTCAQIVINAISSFDCISLWEYLARTQFVRINLFADLLPQKYIARPRAQKKQFPHAIKVSEIHAKEDTVIDPQGPLYKKNIVFTGELSLDRRTAMQMAVDAGAVVKSGVSRKTDYLIVGAQDISVVGEDGLSRKQEIALELNESGKGHIVTLTEDEFVSMTQKGGALCGQSNMP